jgi:hypothetical protein
LETLTPVQRVAVIAIGLALTALVALLILPWVWKQIAEWLPMTDASGPTTLLPTATPDRVSLAGGSISSLVVPVRPTWTGIAPTEQYPQL